MSREQIKKQTCKYTADKLESDQFRPPDNFLPSLWQRGGLHFFVVNHLSFLEKKRSTQPCVDCAPRGLCSISQVKVIFPEASGPSPWSPCWRCRWFLLVEMLVGTHFWKVFLFIFFSEVDGSELWKVQRKCGKLSEIKQFCVLPLGRDISFTSIY